MLCITYHSTTLLLSHITHHASHHTSCMGATGCLSSATQCHRSYNFISKISIEIARAAWSPRRCQYPERTACYCSALPVSIGTVGSCAFSVGTVCCCVVSACASCCSRSFSARSSLCRRAAVDMYPGCAARHRAICALRRVSLHNALFLISMSLYPAARSESMKCCSR
jgi:hypothetical protein